MSVSKQGNAASGLDGDGETQRGPRVWLDAAGSMDGSGSGKKNNSGDH